MAVASFLMRLAYPAKFAALSRDFGRSSAYLSLLHNDITTHLVTLYRDIVEFHPRLQDYDLLLAFGTAVGLRTGRGRNRIWGFIDGTFRPMCRPIVGQQWDYTGHKRRHGVRFQAVATPDGLISSLMGPFRAYYNDWRIYCESDLPYRLRQVSGLFLYEARY
jgi:hypothetical protein